jgi:hypothetical protein
MSVSHNDRVALAVELELRSQLHKLAGVGVSNTELAMAADAMTRKVCELNGWEMQTARCDWKVEEGVLRVQMIVRPPASLADRYIDMAVNIS